MTCVAARQDFSSRAVALLVAALLVVSFKGTDGESLTPYYEWVALGVQLLVAGCIVAMTPKFRLGSESVVFLTGFSLLFIWALASGFWSEDTMINVLVRVLIVFVPIFFLALAVSGGDKIAMFNGFSKVIVLGVTGVILVSFVLYVWGSEAPTEGYKIQTLSLGPLSISQCVMGAAPLYRVCSLFGNPNTLAAYVAIATPLLVYCHRARLLSSVTCLCILLVLFGSFGLTLSRAAFGGFMVALGFMYILGGHNGTQILLRALGMFVAVVILGVAVGQAVISSGAARLEVGLNSREEAWSSLLAGFIDNPLEGVGFGVSAEALLNGNTGVGSAHSLYFMLLAELGSVGFILFLGLWMFVIIKSLRLALRGSSAAAAVFSINIGLVLIQAFEASMLRFSLLHYIWFFLAFWMLSSEPTEEESVSA